MLLTEIWMKIEDLVKNKMKIENASFHMKQNCQKERPQNIRKN